MTADNYKHMTKAELIDRLRSVESSLAEANEERQSHEDCRLLFDSMLEGFALHEIIFDEQGKPVDYRFLIVNPAFERLTGLSADAIIGKTVLEMLPKTEHWWLDTYGRVPEAGQPCRVEHYASELDKHFEVVAFRPRQGQFACLFEDITERRLAENELRRSESKYRTLVENLPQSVLLKDHQSVFISCNGNFAAGLELSPSEVIGRNDLDLYPPDLAAKYRADDKRIMESGRTEEYEERHVTAGRKLIVQTVKTPVKDGHGNTVGILCVFWDITNRKRTEEDRRKLDSRVRHAQKLESLGVLAGGIAHDFNNLLTAILGNADLAISELSQVSPARENIEEIIKASHRAAELCRQMLAYSGKGRFMVGAIDLSEVVDEMAHMLEVSISKKAVLKYDFADNLPFIRADATQMRQVIMNLITNASEAIGDKSGIISITTGAVDCDRAYLQRTYLDEELPEGLYVTLEVADTGRGMDAQTKAKLFDPFFTTKFTGRGLGLAAVLGIVRGHRGAIKVYSELGRGTTFKVLLPAAKRQISDDSKLRAIRRPAGTGTVLLVDDEETIRAVGKRMLENLGYTVLTASDGRQAVDMYHDRPETFDCVVLDLTMPHMDGEEAFRELRRIDKDVRVVLSSGYNEQEVTQRFVGKGLAGFIQKPYRLDVLANVMKEALPDA